MDVKLYMCKRFQKESLTSYIQRRRIGIKHVGLSLVQSHKAMASSAFKLRRFLQLRDSVVKLHFSVVVKKDH